MIFSPVNRRKTEYSISPSMLLRYWIWISALRTRVVNDALERDSGWKEEPA